MKITALIQILDEFCKLAHHVNPKSPLLVGVTHYITAEIKSKLSTANIPFDKKDRLIALFESAFSSHDKLYITIKLIADPSLVMRQHIRKFETDGDSCIKSLNNLVTYLKSEVFQSDLEAINLINSYDKEFKTSTQIAFDLFYKTIYIGRPLVGDRVIDLTLGFHSKLHGFLSRLLNMVLEKYGGDVDRVSLEQPVGFLSRLKSLF